MMKLILWKKLLFFRFDTIRKDFPTARRNEFICRAHRSITKDEGLSNPSTSNVIYMVDLMLWLFKWWIEAGTTEAVAAVLRPSRKASFCSRIAFVGCVALNGLVDEDLAGFIFCKRMDQRIAHTLFAFWASWSHFASVSPFSSWRQCSVTVEQGAVVLVAMKRREGSEWDGCKSTRVLALFVPRHQGSGGQERTPPDGRLFSSRMVSLSRVSRFALFTHAHEQATDLRHALYDVVTRRFIFI